MAVKTLAEQCWRGSPVLTSVAALMVLVLLGNLVGLLLDERLITGAPAWLKPSKFAVSVFAYAATLALYASYLGRFPAITRTLCVVTGVCLVTEIALINLQAARGVPSHFNVGTPLDGMLFKTMGVMILLLWLSSVVFFLLALVQKFDDRQIGLALQLGLLLTVFGAAIGGLMTSPRPGQLTGDRPTMIGSHTVGAPDGGPGLPLTNWSREHGDLRVPHFLGLHALQIMPAIVIFLRRSSGMVTSAQVLTIAASYSALTLILLLQAMRGEPVAKPYQWAIATLSIWLGGSLWAWQVAGQ